jgi:O-6-methylguanine DNA methyltransferase
VGPYREGEGLGYAVFPTVMGWMALAASAQGLVEVVLPRPTPEDVLARMQARWPQARPLPTEEAEPLVKPFQDYLEGKCTDLEMPVDLSSHTSFRRKVWEVTRHIPYGQTRSYAWVARQIGQPRAARAVGQAMGANPVPILIPCHRVVGSDGGLCGYGGGLDMKARLLALERETLTRVSEGVAVER